MKYLLLLLLTGLFFSCDDDCSCASKDVDENCSKEQIKFIEKHEECSIPFDDSLKREAAEVCYLYGKSDLSNNETESVNKCLNNINSFSCSELPNLNQNIENIEGCLQFSKKSWRTKQEICIEQISTFCIFLYNSCQDDKLNNLCQFAYIIDEKTNKISGVDKNKFKDFCETYPNEPATIDDLQDYCIRGLTCEQFEEIQYNFENIQTYCSQHTTKATFDYFPDINACKN